MKTRKCDGCMTNLVGDYQLNVISKQNVARPEVQSDYAVLERLCDACVIELNQAITAYYKFHVE